jgi:hypothetical protein
MSDALREFENELEFEAEGEFESEFESELEAEFENEAEAFGWADAKNWASNEWNALTTPGSAERKVLLTAAKTAAPLVGTGLGTLVGGRLGNPSLGGTVGGGIGTWAAGLLPDKESEFEFEAEFESEFEGEGEFEFESEGEFESFVNPVGRIYPDALAEHMGLAAMESESELEAAEHFAPLIPVVAAKVLPAAAKLGARAMPQVARVINHATPHLTRGVTQLARVIHRDPRTRPLVRVIPSVAQRTVTRIARHAAAGHKVSPQRAVRILRHENHRVLSNPRILHGVLRHARRMDRHAGQVTGLPLHGRHHHHHAGHPYARHHHHWRYHPGHPKYLAYLRWRRMRGLPTTYGAAAPGAGWGGAGAALPPRFGGGTARMSVCPTCGQAVARRVCSC